MQLVYMDDCLPIFFQGDFFCIYLMLKDHIGSDFSLSCEFFWTSVSQQQLGLYPSSLFSASASKQIREKVGTAACSLPFSNIPRHSAFQPSRLLIDNVKDHHAFVRHRRGEVVEATLEIAEEQRFLYTIDSCLRFLFLFLKFHFLESSIQSFKTRWQTFFLNCCNSIIPLSNLLIWLYNLRPKANCFPLMLDLPNLAQVAKFVPIYFSSENFVKNSFFL